MQKRSYSILAATLGLMYQISHANPWLTGPLLALPAKTVPRGHITVFYETDTAISDSIYNRDWRWVPQQSFSSTQISPQLSYGLTDRLDLQYNALYEINQNENVSYEHIGDTAVIIGFQALSQEKNHSYPDLRITLQETLPTGFYTGFSSARNGAEATGMGSYQTSLGLNFQYLSQLNEQHYLNSHLSVTYTYAGTARLNGLSTYGGTSQTKGRINPGNAVSIDLAGEFTLTTKWVAVMEANFIYQQASSFHGIIGVRSPTDPLAVSTPQLSRTSHRLLPTKHNIGNPDIGSGNLDQITLAPAMEYNFSDSYGVIAGVWFTVAGKNTPEFITPIIQFSASW